MKILEKFRNRLFLGDRFSIEIFGNQGLSMDIRCRPLISIDMHSDEWIYNDILKLDLYERNKNATIEQDMCRMHTQEILSSKNVCNIHNIYF